MPIATPQINLIVIIKINWKYRAGTSIVIHNKKNNIFRIIYAHPEL